DDDALVAGEPVHLGEDLVERLLPLIVAADRRRAAPCTADGIQLVDEDDRRGHLLGLLEQITYATGSDTNDHLDELRGRHREERHVRLAGNRTSQQRLSGARWTGQQHAARDLGAQPAIPLGVAQEVDDLGNLVLHLIDTGDVGKRGAWRGRWLVKLGAGPADAADATQPAAGGGPSPEPHQ